MNLLLFAPEYRPNLSNMIRSAEFYGYKSIYIYDQNGLLDPPNNKVSRGDMEHLARVWTAGAIEFIEIVKIKNIQEFLDNYKGRKIATVINPQAQLLKNFGFEANDLLIMGPEKGGLPGAIIEQCDKHIYIQAFGHTDCLNVSVSLGIFLYEMSKQLKVLS